MDRFEMLTLLEQGLENGRISPHIAAFIAAELFGVEAYETGYQEWHRPVEGHEFQELATVAD